MTEELKKKQLARAFAQAKVTLNDEEQSRVATADAFLDEAYDQLDEEPSLKEFLSSNYELGEVRWAEWSVLHWVLLRAINEGVRIDVIINYIEAQISRIQAATAMAAVMNERKRASENP